jgi:uncharacterized protein (TIGR00251 family)
METDLYDVRDNGTVVLRVHVHPGAGRTAIHGRHGDALKISVAAPPQGGRANEAVTELLAEVFGIKKDAVQIVTGQTSRAKAFVLAGMEESDVAERLELALDDAARRPGGGVRNR